MRIPKKVVAKKPERTNMRKGLAIKLEYEVARLCCVCLVAGKALQIHHLNGDPSNNSENNLALLCLQCHSDAESNGGLGRKLSSGYILKAKSDLIEKTKFKREIHLIASVGDASAPSATTTERNSDFPLYSDATVNEFGMHQFHMPSLLFRILLAAKESAINSCMPFLELPAVLNPSEGITRLVEGYRQIFRIIAGRYPADNFGIDGGRAFFDRTFGSVLDFELSCASFMRGMQGQYSWCNSSLVAMKTIDRMFLETIRLIDAHSQSNAIPSNEFSEFQEKWNALEFPSKG